LLSDNCATDFASWGLSTGEFSLSSYVNYITYNFLLSKIKFMDAEEDKKKRYLNKK
jgi:hypothetical protein